MNNIYKNKKIALILTGGICSGKTTLANFLKHKYNFEIISKDMAIYESDMSLRKGEKTSWEEVRIKRILELSSNIVVVDETLRVGKLTELKSLDFTIVSIKLNTSFCDREKRLQNRLEVKDKKLRDLSNIAGVDLCHISQAERREKYWTNDLFYQSLDKNKIQVFESILKEVYLLGSYVLKPEEPNPICFHEVDYIYEINKIADIENITIDRILSEMQSTDDYILTVKSRHKYCVWDVGGVFYKYTLRYLQDWCIENSSCKSTITFDFKYILNKYMVGHIDFFKFCDELCDLFNIPMNNANYEKIDRLLKQGVGELYEEVEEVLNLLQKAGVINCVLSNALPLLVDRKNYQEYIKIENRFYSFDINSLKPNIDMFIYVKESLKSSFNEMVFIDDKEENVNAAKDLGVYSILFDRKTIKQEVSKIFNL